MYVCCGGSLKPQKGQQHHHKLGSWGQKQSEIHLGGSEMTTSYRAVKDCLSQRKKLMRSWYQIQKVTGLLTA